MRKLTPTMERHMRELAALGREACWRPADVGEWRCAEALVRRGLLSRNPSSHRPFEITPEGYELGCELARAASTEREPR